MPTFTQLRMKQLPIPNQVTLETSGLVMRKKIKVNPELETYLPPMHEDSFMELESSILASKLVRDPLVLLWEEEGQKEYTLLEGHNRFRIVQKYPKITFKVSYVRLENGLNDAKAWMIKTQIGRRNLTDLEWKLFWGELYNDQKGGRGGARGQDVPLVNVAKELAKDANKSEKYVKRAGKFANAVGKIQQKEGRPVDLRNNAKEKDILAKAEVLSHLEYLEEVGDKHFLSLHQEKPFANEVVKERMRQINEGLVEPSDPYTLPIEFKESSLDYLKKVGDERFLNWLKKEKNKNKADWVVDLRAKRIREGIIEPNAVIALTYEGSEKNAKGKTEPEPQKIKDAPKELRKNIDKAKNYIINNSDTAPECDFVVGIMMGEKSGEQCLDFAETIKFKKSLNALIEEEKQNVAKVGNATVQAHFERIFQRLEEIAYRGDEPSLSKSTRLWGEE